MRTERRSRVSRERGEARETRGGGVRLVAAPRARRERSPARRGNKVTTWAITGWRRGTREARGRARTRRCLSPWRSRRGLGRGKRARGVSRLSVEPRGPCAVVYRCRPRGPEPRLGSGVCFRPSARVFARGATTDRRREFRIDGTVFSRVFFLIVQQRSLHGTRRVARRAEEECSSERRNVVPMLTCRAPP